MYPDDTICALSTPAGAGAIALIRVSGKDAFAICDRSISLNKKGNKISKLPGNTIHSGKMHHGNQPVDDVLVSIFRAPRSYTGENIVEISCHGSVFIQQKILEILFEDGARLALPGEFTQRAFLNGKMDLSQAEGVADLIASQSAGAHRLALNQMRGGFSLEIRSLRDELLHFVSLIELELDFSEEDVEFADRKQLLNLTDRIHRLIENLILSFEYGNAMKQGIPVAIIGPTNSGKSTLLNCLLREEKAIVSEVAGTTRDYIEDIFILDGMQFRFIDTAGLRHTTDKIETEGIRRTMKKFRQASIVLIMADLTEDPAKTDHDLAFIRNNKEEYPKKTLILVLNKKDLITPEILRSHVKTYKRIWGNKMVSLAVSAKHGEGIKQLEKLLISSVRTLPASEQQVVVTNVRHLEALKPSLNAIKRVKNGLGTNIPGDLLAQDIREVLHYLGEITGEITTDEILGNIFKNFCIGK